MKNSINLSAFGTPVALASNITPNGNKNSNNGKWFILGMVVAGAIAIYFIKKRDEKKDKAFKKRMDDMERDVTKLKEE